MVRRRRSLASRLISLWRQLTFRERGFVLCQILFVPLSEYGKTSIRRDLEFEECGQGHAQPHNCHPHDKSCFCVSVWCEEDRSDRVA